MSKLGTEEAEQIIRQYSDMIYRIAVHNLSNIAESLSKTELCTAVSAKIKVHRRAPKSA